MEKNFTGFCLRALLFLLLVFFVDRAVGYGFVAMKDAGLRNNPENMWLKTPFVVEEVSADIVVIGSSKASHHYVPKMLADEYMADVYNCGQDGCFFLYQNCLINMLLDRYQPKLIIWDIQPSSFINENTTKEYQNFRYLSSYYQGSSWVEQYVDSESPKMAWRMQSRMFAYNSKLLNSLFPLVAQSSKTDYGYIPLPNEGYHYPTMTKPQDDSGFRVSEDYLEKLGQTAQRCNDNGVELQVVVSPEYVQESSAIEAAIASIRETVANNGANCLDYLSCPMFMQDSTLFKDNSHLNDNGARRFTQRIISDMRKVQ